MASSKSAAMAASAYPYPYTANVANFVSVKLSGHEKYPLWKTQMLCLIEGHDMLGFIDGTLEPPPDTNPDAAQWWRRSDALLRGWILGSLSNDILTNIIGLKTVKDVWVKLESSYNSPTPEFSSPVVVKAEIDGGLIKTTATPHSRSLPVPIYRGVSQQMDLKGDSATSAADSKISSSLSRFSRGLERTILPEESWAESSPTPLSSDIAEITDSQQGNFLFSN